MIAYYAQSWIILGKLLEVGEKKLVDADPDWKCSLTGQVTESGTLNLSQFVEDQNGPSIGQILSSSLCWQ